MYVEVDEAGLKEAGIKYLGLQLVDTESQKIGHVFKVSYFCQIKSKQRIKLRQCAMFCFHLQETGDWMNAAMCEGLDTRVLVNCWAGISRSATIATAFLVS